MRAIALPPSGFLQQLGAQDTVISKETPALVADQHGRVSRETQWQHVYIYICIYIYMHWNDTSIVAISCLLLIYMIIHDKYDNMFDTSWHCTHGSWIMSIPVGLKCALACDRCASRIIGVQRNSSDYGYTYIHTHTYRHIYTHIYIYSYISYNIYIYILINIHRYSSKNVRLQPTTVNCHGFIS